jgi:hypothetical protein
MAAALILTADQLATDWIFSDDMHLTIEEIKPFLLSKGQVSANERAYDFICDWVRQNKIDSYQKIMVIFMARSAEALLISSLPFSTGRWRMKDIRQTAF